MVSVNAIMQQRRDTAANFATENAVYASGEILFETDTRKIKIGDGVTAYSALGFSTVEIAGSFTSYSDFVADTGLTYAVGLAGSVAAGDLIFAGGGYWEVAASDAADQHGTTAGGVKWYEAGPNFSTRARMVAAKARMDAASDTVPVGTIWWAAGHAYRASSGATAIGDMAGWVAVAPVWLEHYGIVTSAAPQDATTDYATELQAAISNTRGTLHASGWAYSASGLLWNSACGFKIMGDIEDGGIVTDSAIGTTDNLIDFGTGLGPLLDSLHLWFRQPAGITTRAQLYDHAPLISANDASRGNIRHLRISQASTGLTAVDGVSGSNPGGWKIGVAEIGAFDAPYVTDGALDFIKIEHLHVWPFGIADDPDLMAIWSDGAATGSQIITADGLMIDTFASFQMPVEVGDSTDTSIIPFIMGMQLDGDNSRLTLKGGRSVINYLYSTKTGTPTATTLVAEAGIHHLNMPHFVGGEAQMIEARGGATLNVLGGYLRQHLSANKRGAVVKSGGRLRFKGTHFDFPTGAGTVPFVEQEAGGVLVVDGCSVILGNATPRSEVVKFNSDVVGNYVDIDQLKPHGVTYPANSLQGIYRRQGGVLGATPAITGNVDGIETGTIHYTGDISEATAVSWNLPALGGTDTRAWVCHTYGQAARTVQQATEILGVGTTRGRTFIRVRQASTWYSWVEL